MEFQTTGEYLRFLRTSSGFSLKELSDFLKISDSYLARIERNERSLNLELLPVLSEFLQIELKEIQKNVIALSLIEHYKGAEGATEGIKLALKNI